MGVATVFIRMTIVIMFYTEYMGLLPTTRFSTASEPGGSECSVKGAAVTVSDTGPLDQFRPAAPLAVDSGCRPLSSRDFTPCRTLTRAARIDLGAHTPGSELRPAGSVRRAPSPSSRGISAQGPGDRSPAIHARTDERGNRHLMPAKARVVKRAAPPSIGSVHPCTRTEKD